MLLKIKASIYQSWCLQVTKFNAYAIHGSGADRVYESLYPADQNLTAPDLYVDLSLCSIHGLFEILVCTII